MDEQILRCGCFSQYFGNEHLHDLDGHKRYFWPPISNGPHIGTQYTEVSYDYFIHLCYVSERSRFTNQLANRLIRADKEIPSFDWISVSKGEEDEELKKYGI